ncbi:MAG: iron-sulfur cluster assembly scaffold protein [Deltaproteobacteria bacterium]|nr:iron-sulfur cluster assembly scaffold protein [Deltaproteobacteria bacterium]
MRFYTRETIEHFLKPRNFGTMKDADAVGTAVNGACSDMTKIFIRIENDVITDCSVLTQGCCAAIASASIFSELIKGTTVSKALEITTEDISTALKGLPETKKTCSVIAPLALKDAINNLSERK